ncbi:MAG: hypothetical protein JOZ64_08405, partial [Solirubrobacterales bacterium]|nr:hypothetical protein [Solirubrobacterales bacterium]
HDDIPERAFFMKGTIDDVVREAGGDRDEGGARQQGAAEAREEGQDETRGERQDETRGEGRDEARGEARGGDTDERRTDGERRPEPADRGDSVGARRVE